MKAALCRTNADRWLEHVGVGMSEGDPFGWSPWRSYVLRLEEGNMKNWVVLFARTGSEEDLRDMLREQLDADEFLPFVPTREASYRKKGTTQIVRKPLFPGYIILQTEMEANLIANNLKIALDNLKNKKHFYSILHYGDDQTDVAVREEERLYWERLFDENFCIPGSIGVIEGDMTRVTSGSLMGMEGRIKRICRHKREAVVEMSMMGSTREITLMLEIVEKT